MAATFSETPVLFGKIHIGFVMMTILLCVLTYFYVKNKPVDFMLKLLRYIGFFMILAEVVKQLFCFFYIADKQIDLTNFPWQLCSLSMYLSFLAPSLKDDKQEAVLVFLSTFSLMAGVLALATPKNMLVDMIFLTTHSFLYHAFMLAESVIAIQILGKRKRPVFRYALVLFLITAGIAEIVNVLGKLLINDPAREPNMFFISPFYPTKQILLCDIANSIGIIPEVIVYLTGIILISHVIFIIECKTLWQKRNCEDY